MKKPNPINPAVATDKKRQVILRSPEMRRALNRALLTLALKENPCQLRIVFEDRDSRHIGLEALNNPDNILCGIPRTIAGGLELDVPDLPWIRKALAQTGAKITLTELV